MNSMSQTYSLPNDLPFPECLKILFQFRDDGIYVPEFLRREGYTPKIVSDYLSAEAETFRSPRVTTRRESN